MAAQMMRAVQYSTFGGGAAALQVLGGGGGGREWSLCFVPRGCGACNCCRFCGHGC